MIELVLLALLAADIYIKWIAYSKDTHNIYIQQVIKKLIKTLNFSLKRGAKKTILNKLVKPLN